MKNRSGVALVVALLFFGTPASAAREGASAALAAAAAAEDEALAHKSRGRHAEALEAYLKAAEILVDASLPSGAPEDASAPDPLVLARAGVYLLAADNLALRADRVAQVRERLDALAAKAVDPLLRARIDDLRRGYAQRLGDFAGAQAITRSLGFVTDWMVIGPFDNERGGGFSATHPPEKAIDPAGRYPGKLGEVGWRRLPIPDRSYVDLDTLLYPDDEALAFALTHVYSEEDRPACARFGTDESFKLWVNDRLVASRDARRPCRFDQEAAGFTLRHGWNRILLMDAERTGEWGFALRLTTPEGAPLGPDDGIRVEADPAVATPLAVEPGDAAPPAVRPNELRSLAPIARERGDGRSLFHLALLHTFVREEDEGSTAALDAVREAARLEPEKTAYAHLQALASVRPASMSPEREENEKRRLLEKILEFDPGNAEAALTLALYYENSLSNHEKAESLAEAALKSNPGYVEARLFRVASLRRLSFEPQADEALAALAAEPGSGASSGAVLGETARVAAARHQNAKAEAILVDLLARDRANSGARRDLFRLYLATGRTSDALDLLASSLALNPYDLAARFLRADALIAADRLDEAAAELEEALRVAPDRPEAVERLARLEHRRGREAEARALFDRALKLDPNDRQLRRYVEFLESTERPFEERYPFDRDASVAAARAVTSTGNEAFVETSARTIVKVNRDGTAARYVHRLYKVLNEEGARTLDAVPVPFAIGDQRVRVLVNRVLRADGTEREGRTSNASGDDSGGGPEYRTYALRSIDLPPLVPGDVVEIAYRLDDARQSFFGDYFGLTHAFREGAELARVLRSELVLVTPESRPVVTRSLNGAPEGETVPADEPGFSATRYVMTDLPSIEPEPFMPGPEEFAPAIQATTYRSWDDFASWWWNLIRRELQISDEMRETLSRLVKDARDEEEMIRAVYDFVVSDIRYNAWEFGVHGYQPYNASTICARRFGDCKDKAIVIVTLLRELGIAAYPVVIHAAEPRPKEDLTLALVDHFNHCIAYAEPKGGKPRFLDGTAEYHDVSTLPDMDRGATVVVVRDGAPEIVTIPMPPPEENVHEIDYDVSIRPDRGALVSLDVRAQGTPAAMERRVLQNPGRRREVIENQLIREFGSARYLDSKAENVTRLTRDASWSAKADVPEMVKRSGASLSLPVTFRKISLAQFATQETRSFDLLLPTPALRRRTVTYRLPEGLAAGPLPAPVRLDGPFGKFSMVAESVDARTIRVTTEVAMSATRVAPADYPAFREFALAAFRAMEQVVPLSEVR